MKVAVYAIALNEEAFAEPFMASCREADLVLVADTGSTDQTVARLSALGADVRRISIKPWRFDQARNTALDLLPPDVDVCVSLDLDQTLAPGWRHWVEEAWRGGATQLYYTHIFTQPGDSGQVVFQDNRIHARHGFSWLYPCHECIIPQPGFRHHAVTDMRLKVLHAPDTSKSRSSYLPLLELAAQERPDDSRPAHYLGREYFYQGRHAEAAREFERYIALTTVEGFERNGTRRMLAHCREELGDADAALAEFRAAANEEPGMRGAWVSLAWACHRRQLWDECLGAAEHAISIREEKAHYGDDVSPGVVAEDLACLASWSLGHPWTSLDYARDALGKAPDNPRIRANLARIEAAMASGERIGFGVSQTALDENGQPIPDPPAEIPAAPASAPRSAAASPPAEAQVQAGPPESRRQAAGRSRSARRRSR